MNHIVVFILYFFGDWCGAHWAVACSRNQARPASIWSLCYHLIHGVAVLFIVNDPWCVLSLAAGGALGCYFAINHKVKKICRFYDVSSIANIDRLEGFRG